MAAFPPDLPQLLAEVEDYASTIPDEVTQHFLNTSGFSANDPRLIRIVSIATQRFASSIASDALQIERRRTARTTGGAGGTAAAAAAAAAAASAAATTTTNEGGEGAGGGGAAAAAAPAPVSARALAASGRRAVLAVEDVAEALSEYGIELKKPPYLTGAVVVAAPSEQQQQGVRRR